MAKMGRPKKEINQDQFEKLCGMQCTYEEICAWFDVTDKTLNAWCRETYGSTFSDVFAVKRNRGKVSLRRAGFELAQKNAAVHIFYAKNYLGMKDSLEVENTEALAKLDDILGELKGEAETERETE